ARGLLILAAIDAYAGTPLAKRLSDEYARIIGTPPADHAIPERALFEAGLLFGETPSENAGDDLVRAFERTVLTEKLRDATARLRHAESAKDDEAMRRALTDCKEISARLATLG
ncbi:MAG TPA: hypothetical protein PK109_03685, partial [Candidatus Paceibacterota bacterium]|nr:hypothetical protein [Candidatus Paceibacterota bacterium]